MNIYLDLTTAFNSGGRLRAVICSEQAAIPWREQWPEVRREIESLPLGEAHRIVTAKAEPCLPRKPSLPTA